MVDQYVQEMFYHYVVGDPALAEKWDPSYFDSPVIRACFKYAREHSVKYREAPSLEQMKEILRVEGVLETIDEESVSYLYEAKKNMGSYTDDWLHENVIAWGEWRSLISGIQKTISYIKISQDKVCPENVKDITERAKGMFNETSNVDFNGLGRSGSDFWNAISHKREKLKRTSTGYDFVDMCMDGGYFPGCLTVFVGSPKVGKSMWLQNLCLKSVMHGENCVYVSLELPEEMVVSRIGSNLLSIPSKDYVKYSDNVDDMSDRLSKARKSGMVPCGDLIVKSFPTSSASVIDIESYLLEEEANRSVSGSKFKIKNVFIDYINIMRNYRNPNSENTYMKIKQLAEDVRAMGIKNGWSIITATQSKRDQTDNDDMDGKDVSESNALAATVDIMFGIIATPVMKANGEYLLKCLYDRLAPEDNKRKRYLVDKTHLRITEDPDSPIEDANSLQMFRPTISNSKSGKRMRCSSLGETSIDPETGIMDNSEQSTSYPQRIVANTDFESKPIMSAPVVLDGGADEEVNVAGMMSVIKINRHV